MPRTRRSPAQAKAEILQVAADRLGKHGLRGLNIKDIAEEAGMNHGTLLHHFGSAEEMRSELLEIMTADLISRMIQIMDSGAQPGELIQALFELLSTSGQIKLIAWRAMEESDDRSMGSGKLLEEVVDKVAAGMLNRDIELARKLIFLTVSSAIGWGICGANFKEALGMDVAEQDDFPAWVSSQLPRLIS